MRLCGVHAGDGHGGCARLVRALRHGQAVPDAGVREPPGHRLRVGPAGHGPQAGCQAQARGAPGLLPRPHHSKSPKSLAMDYTPSRAGLEKAVKDVCITLPSGRAHIMKDPVHLVRAAEAASSHTSPVGLPLPTSCFASQGRTHCALLSVHAVCKRSAAEQEHAL